MNSKALKAAPQLSSARSGKKEEEKFFLTHQGVNNEEGKENGNPESSTGREIEEEKFNNPKQMVELLKRIDDATIFLIHNTQEKEEDLEKTRKAFEQQKQQIDEKYKNRKEALAQVQKLHEKLEKVRINF